MRELGRQSRTSNGALAKALTSFCALAAMLLCPQAAPAQDERHPARGFHAGGSYALSDIETVSMSGGNLMMNVPLGSLPAGRGGSPGFRLGLTYNSKLYDSHIDPVPNDLGVEENRNHINQSEDGGWRYTLPAWYSMRVVSRLDEEPGPPCAPEVTPYEYQRNSYIWKVQIVFPDGSTREFRPVGATDQFYDGYFNVSPNGWLFQDGLVSGGESAACTHSETQATTAPMVYYSTDGSYTRLVVEHDPNPADHLGEDNPWTLYFPDGSRVRSGWPGEPQRTYDRNNNYVDLLYISYNGHPAYKVIDQLGRHVIVEIVSQYDPNTATVARQDYVRVKGTSGEEMVWTVRWKQIYVYKQYLATIQAGGLERGNSYLTPWVGFFLVVDQITLPAQAGGLTYAFGYNAADYDGEDTRVLSHGWGELSSVTLPSGATASYAYGLDGVNATESLPRPTWRGVLNNTPAGKTLAYQAEYDGAAAPVTESWIYNRSSLNESLIPVIGSITGPDGGVTTESFFREHNGPFAGRSYMTVRPDGTAVERIWRENRAPGLNGPRVNPLVKTEFTSIRDAAGNYTKTAIKDYSHDKNGNVTAVREYDWVAYGSVPRDAYGSPTGIPAGAPLKRVTTSRYYNQTPDSVDTTTNSPHAYYRLGAPQLLGAVESTEVSDGSQALSRAEFTYDDPNTKGNLTEQKSWDSTKGAYSNPLTASNSVTVSHQYDGYANHTLTTDARGVQTKFVYGTVGGHTDLYPTETRAAENYPSLRRTTRTQYDFSTGLATRVTDADNNVSAATVYDVFGRPTLSCAADNVPAARACTATEYSDPLRRVVVRKDLDNAQDGKLVTVQHFDQLGRVRLSRQLEDSSAQSPYEETHGVKVQTRYAYGGPNSYQLVSNPYRAGYSHQAGGEPTMGWSRAKSDQGGRAVEVQTFNGASLPAPWGANTASSGSVTTSYDAEYTTVTDQAGKVRRSVTSGLGLLARVDEPDGNGNLGSAASPAQQTSYSYDALGNLTQVQQGAQARTFAYSSLSRLTSATNPESGTVSYTYDANGNLKTKTDARQITITYDYDELNRSVTVDYSDTPSINPDVSRFYDNPAAGLYGKGRFWYDYAGGNHAAGQTVEHAAVDSYDALGRPVVRRQLFKAGGTWGAPYQTSRQYDRAGAVVSQTYPSGRTVSYSYDAAGRVAGFAGNLGGGAQRTYADQITYDGAGRMREERFGTAAPLYHKLNYNARGQLYDVRLSTAGGAQGEWNWDRGRLTFYYGAPLAPHGQSGATNNGNVARVEHWVPMDPNVAYGAGGQGPWAIYYQDYQYDALNRLKSATERKVASGGAPEVTNFVQAYDYDRWGNRQVDAALTTGGAGETQFEMGQAASNNRLLAPGDLARPEGERLMRYDAAGNLTHDGYTGGGGRSYDAENRMTGAWGPGALPGAAFESRYGYDADGRRVRRLTPGENVWQVYGLDGELLAEYAANGSPSAPKKEYGYRAGELLVVAEAGGGASGGWGPPPALSDNPLVAGQTVVRSLHITQLREAIDALRGRVGQGAYQWQTQAGQGDPVSAAPIAEMRSALDEALGAPSGGYSAGLAQGLPIKAVHIQELRERVAGAWQVGGSSSGADVRWLVTDHLGTPRMTADLSGSLAGIRRHDYFPFGEEIGDGVGGRTAAQGYVGNADGVRQRYTSKERDDETGLDYFGARYYASTQGRFTSPDPLLSSGTVYNPQTWNRYAYTINNPLKYTDPFGMYICTGTKDQCKDVEKGLTNLEKARDSFKKGSNEYNRLDRALKAYGAKGVDNGVTINFGATKSGAPAAASIGIRDKDQDGVKDVTADNPTGQDTIVTIDPSQNKSADDYVQSLGHEGSHVADGSDLVAAVPTDLTNTAAVAAILGGPLNLTKYVTETGAYEVSSFIAQGRGAGSLTVGPKGGNKYEIWNSGWSQADRAAKRAAGIDKVLAEPKSKGGRYQVTPANQGDRLIP